MRDIPEYYEGKVDVIEMIMNRRGVKSAIDFCFDNILKYATRMTRKGQLESDLLKINVYSKRAIEMIRGLDDGYEGVLDEMTDCSDIGITVDYLNGHFGLGYALDYIQGRLIETALSQRGDVVGEYDLECAFNALTLATCYTILLPDLEGEAEDCLDEEEDCLDEDESVIDESVNDVINSLQSLGNVIVKEIFKA